MVSGTIKDMSKGYYENRKWVYYADTTINTNRQAVCLGQTTCREKNAVFTKEKGWVRRVIKVIRTEVVSG
ncbi:hypothetical protein GCM10027347_37930 [Larkinella harenae]